MVFGEIKRHTRWERARNELGRIFFAIPIDVHVEALRRDIMSHLVRPFRVVVVPDDLPLLVLVPILELHHESCHVPLVGVETNPYLERP